MTDIREERVMSKLLEYFKGDELAASVWQSKYALEGEETPDDMHKRMAKEFARIEAMYIVDENSLGETLKKQEAEMFLSHYGQRRGDLTESNIYGLFKDFKYVIPQGSIMSQLGAPQIGSLSNCFVIGQPHDSYGGIMQKDEQLVQLMKRRGGVGIDISTLRPESVATSNAAKSSTGAISFMHRFSSSTREVAQNGRRGALMLSIDINHPDVMEFIKIKRDLSQVTGANISIKLNDEFMKAVENNEDYTLRFPCDLELPKVIDSRPFTYGQLYPFQQTKLKGGYYKIIKAREYWDEIIKSAHNVAEPGLMYWGSMVGYSPDGVYPQFRQITTNPCSEIGMQAYDACRLIAVNLFGYVVNPFTKDAYFDFDKFYEYNYEAMRLSDDLIDLELEHINRILDKIENDSEPEEIKRVEKELWENVKKTAMASRRTGLGLTGLGDTIAALGFKYQSDEGLTFVEQMMKIKMKSELDCTTDMAITRGTFEGWDPKLENTYSENGGLPSCGENGFYQFLWDEFFEESKRMLKYGRRNVSWSTIAPTGSLSIMAQVTSGLEPLFMPYYMRRKKVNPGEGVRVDFTDQNGDTWQEYPVVHEKFKDWMITNMKPGTIHSEEEFNKLTKEDLERAFELSPWYGATANDIPWDRRVEIQSTLQKYITHSISSTVNLPNDVSEEEVSNIYMTAWKKGLKGITVYRDGSRSGVLVSGNEKKSSTFEYNDSVKRPKELQAEAHVTTVKGEKFTVIVGQLDNKPYEIFAYLGNGLKGPGTIVKLKRGEYIFITPGDNDTHKVLTDVMTDEQAAITRLISTSLRHGADIKYIVEQMNKSDGDIFSYTKAIARVLKKYIPDGAESTVACSECGSSNVIFEEGCQMCKDCGNGKCG